MATKIFNFTPTTQIEWRDDDGLQNAVSSAAAAAAAAALYSADGETGAPLALDVVQDGCTEMEVEGESRRKLGFLPADIKTHHTAIKQNKNTP